MKTHSLSTRRAFLGTAAAAAASFVNPRGTFAADKPNSVFNGVRIGCITYSYRSMAKMKTVTPKMQAIRERFKNDPVKMQQATMELYKAEKINPLGGCLPILVQMPVFLALYWVLQAAVEMRGAPWVGWIHDLTAPDPYFILPILYAISMFITQKLNPQPADPMQAKMMLFMPLAFSVIFLFFPSGLVLYWVVNNLISMAQQYVITKKFAPAK